MIGNSFDHEVRNFTDLLAARRLDEAVSLSQQIVRAWPDRGIGWKALGSALASQQRFEEALPALRRSQELLPRDVESRTNLGNVLHGLGRHTEAEASFRAALDLDGACVAAHHGLGNQLAMLGRPADAEPCYRHALKLAPEDVVLHNHLGLACVGMGRLDAAEACFRRALALRPGYAEALSNLGGVLRDRGNLRDAEAALRHALDLDPAHHGANFNLGHVLRDSGNLPEAEASYRCALQLKPGDAEAYNSLGVAILEQGRAAAAEAAFREAVKLNPGLHLAWSNLGVALREQGRLSDAEAACREALRLRPDSDLAYINLGNVFRDLGQPLQAQEKFCRALECNPANYAAHNGLGALQREMGRASEAEASFREVLRLRPDSFEAHINLGNVLGDLGRLQEAETSYRRALELKPDCALAYSNLLFLLAYSGAGATASYLAQAKAWEVAVLPAQARAETRAKPFARRSRGERLRIGYVSGDFRTHPISFFMQRVLENHDRRRVEVFAYPTIGVRDAATEQIRRSADAWHPLSGIPDDEAVALIARDRIDVLVDLSGHTAYNRLGVFARRAAPVQCQYLGYFASTGLSEIDYVIADEVLVPEAHDGQYRERVWRLPRIWISYAVGEEMDRSDRQPDPAGRVRLGSFNHLGKITERTVALWARLLRRLPDSLLLLKALELDDPSNRSRIIAAFERQGIEPSRIELQGQAASWKAHMELYNQVDIALDPVGGHGGATTTCDALWMGVPVVTLAGSRYGERMSHSIISAIGRGEWSAVDEEDYIGKVAQLAADPEGRREIRLSLRERILRSPLTDASGLARALEDAYEAMFERWAVRQPREGRS